MKADNQVFIDQIVERINASPFLIVVDYTGLTVGQFTEFRDKLRENGAHCQVAKNSYVKRAATTAELPEGLSDLLVGQTAVITGESDVVGAAKAIKDFAKTTEKPEVKGGVLDGAILDVAGISQLADLPSREALLSQLLGLLSQPATSLARILNEPGASLARVLQAKADQG